MDSDANPKMVSTSFSIIGILLFVDEPRKGAGMLVVFEVVIHLATGKLIAGELVFFAGQHL